MTRSRTDVTKWQWRLASTNDHEEAITITKDTPSLSQWADVASFPSVVQMELQTAKLIPDVNIGENERLTQWAGHADWEYQATFASPESTTDNNSEIDLVFDGLDTFSTVTLNGAVLLQSDNMFLPQRVSVKDKLNAAGKDNTLHILFESPYKKGTELEDQYGVRPALFRDARRNYIRKAQYHWGWDWGPIVVTAGPYLPVYLDSYKARVDNVYVRTTKLADDHKTATVAATVNIVGSGEQSADVRILDPAGKGIATSTVTFSGGETSATATFDLTDPQLWWPNGQGEQHLHSLEVTLSNGQDVYKSRFGIRTITVIQEPLADGEPGSTFMFRVNGRDIFAHGGNWIPADTLLPTVTRQRYFDWVQNARDAHMNMLRVWGGGIYEHDDFFDACDELGLLVWHDYGFACTNLPVHGSFLKSFEKEAEAQTVRLRSRASLAILCGGNEDFMLLDWEKVEYDHGDTKGPFPAGGAFPQRAIYLEILPKLAARLASETFYWANSPWSPGGLEANNLTRGDVHQWSVWHGEQKPYQEYKQLAGRFVSEFGMHGFPVQRTIDYFAPPTGKKGEGRHPQSRLIDCHNKGHGAHTRIARYLAENFRYDMASLTNFAYSSQLMQSEAYAYAVRDWKRMFGGRSASGVSKARCAGSIIWQLNDDYPCTSWSLVDYFIRPKPSWYTVRRLYAPISVASERTPLSRFVDEDNPRAASEPPSFAIFAHNTTPAAVDLTLSLQAYDFWADKWTPLPESDANRKVTLLPGQNTELGTLAPQSSWDKDSHIVLELSLKDDAGKTVARYVDWPEPYRYLEWPNDTKLDVKVEHVKDSKDGSVDAHVTVVANQPLKGVWLEPVYDGTEADDSFEPKWEDNMFDLMPGQAITVSVSGLNGRDVKARFLADWEVGKN